MEIIPDMSSSAKGTDRQATAASDESSALRKRVHAVQRVTGMAATGAGRLLEHIRQMENALNETNRAVGSLPDPDRIRLLAAQIESLQAMLDWVVTRSEPEDVPTEFMEIQTRLSMCRVELGNVRSEIAHGADLARSLQQMQAAFAGLASETATLESTKWRAEKLLLESTELMTTPVNSTQSTTDIVHVE
jgi:hypothetical protein